MKGKLLSTNTFSRSDTFDPLSIDSLYSDDELAVRDSVRGFCAEHEGTPEMHQLVLGQAFTGEKAFR